MKKHPLPSSDAVVNLRFLIENKESVIEKIGEDFYNQQKKDAWELAAVFLKLRARKSIYKRVPKEGDFSDKNQLVELVLHKNTFVESWGESNYNYFKQKLWEKVYGENND